MDSTSLPFKQALQNRISDFEQVLVYCKNLHEQFQKPGLTIKVTQWAQKICHFRESGDVWFRGARLYISAESSGVLCDFDWALGANGDHKLDECLLKTSCDHLDYRIVTYFVVNRQETLQLAEVGHVVESVRYKRLSIWLDFDLMMEMMVD